MIFNSIRARMTAAFGIAISTLMLITCLSITTYARYEAQSRIDDALKSAADKVAFELPVVNAESTSELHQVEDALVAEQIALIIRDARGNVVSHAGRWAAIWPPGQGVGSNQNQEEWRTHLFSAKSYTILIGTPWTQSRQNLRSLAIALLGLSLVVCTSVTLGTWVLVGKTLSPIGLLSQQARQYGKTADGSTVQLDVPSHDAEVVELVATLNELLLRQSSVLAARGRFYAAASHELRTPLQALSGHLELALQRPRTADEYHEVVQEAYTQTRRLTTLTRDLLRLHQLEGAPPPVQETVDLSAVIERTLHSFETAIQERRLHLVSRVPDHIMVASAPTHADMIVRNLVENAVLYTPADGNISISLKPQEMADRGQDKNLDIDRIELIIANSCTNPSGGALEHLFEPFYREDASRSRSSNGMGGGNGLGLAICRALAAVNGWELSLTQEQELVVVHVIYRKGPLPCVSTLS